jgi:hypothetical protein
MGTNTLVGQDMHWPKAEFELMLSGEGKCGKIPASGMGKRMSPLQMVL